MTRKDDLSALANAIISAIEKARHLKLPTSAYILSMALIEVLDEQEAARLGQENDTTP